MAGDWRLRQVTPPSAPVVTVSELKDQLRIDGTLEDDLLERYIQAATEAIEGPYGIGILLGQQTWEYYLDYFPSVIRIPLYPVISIDEISYIDDGGAEQVLPVADYRTDTVSNPARINSGYSKSWPPTRLREPNAVKVTFTGGYTSVPEILKAAIIMWASHMYENRQPVIVGTSAQEIPLGVETILARYRVLGVG